MLNGIQSDQHFHEMPLRNMSCQTNLKIRLIQKKSKMLNACGVLACAYLILTRNDQLDFIPFGNATGNARLKTLFGKL
jgi:hypothetical protein